MMMDQPRTELNGSRSVLILDFKGLDAVAENKLRLDLRKKKIHMRAVKNTLAKRVFTEAGIGGVGKVFSGPGGAGWGGGGGGGGGQGKTPPGQKTKKTPNKGGGG